MYDDEKCSSLITEHIFRINHTEQPTTVEHEQTFAFNFCTLRLPSSSLFMPPPRSLTSPSSSVIALERKNRHRKVSSIWCCASLRRHCLDMLNFCLHKFPGPPLPSSFTKQSFFQRTCSCFPRLEARNVERQRLAMFKAVIITYSISITKKRAESTAQANINVLKYHWRWRLLSSFIAENVSLLHFYVLRQKIM